MVPQRNAQSDVGSMPAVIQGISNSKSLANLPTNDGKSAKPSSSSTDSSEDLFAEASKETGTRKRKLTMKAQVLIENTKTRASKKQSAKKVKASGENRTLAPKLQTTNWIVSPNNLLPVAGMQIKTPDAGSAFVFNNQCAASSNTSPSAAATHTLPSNEGIVNIIPQLPFHSPILVNQNGSLTVLHNFATPIIPSAAPEASSSSRPNYPTPVPSSNPISNVSCVTTTASVVAATGVVMKPSQQCSPQLQLIHPLKVNQDSSLGNTKANDFSDCLLVQPILLPPSSSHGTIKPANNSTQIGPSIPQLQTLQPTGQTDPLKFDPNLIFFKHQEKAGDWMKGNGGISLPEQNYKIPYLPPFVSNINSLASLLKVKKSLLQNAEQILPAEARDINDEDKVAALRTLVCDRFKTNPAYSRLKARFLSCFTLPAFLATINPDILISGEGCDEEEEKYRDQVMQKKQTNSNDQSQVSFVMKL